MNTYLDIRGQIENGDILLFKGNGSFFGRLIKWATASEYCHVGFAWWWDERLMIFQSMEGHGVEYVLASSTVARMEEVTVLRAGPLDEYKMVEFARSKLSQSYSWTSIVEIGWRILLGKLNLRDPFPFYQARDSFICSEYVAACLKEAGFTIPWDKMGFIAPSDFGSYKALKVIGTVTGR